MTLEQVLLALGIGREIIAAIGDLTDLDAILTQEMIADMEAQIAKERAKWDAS